MDTFEDIVRFLKKNVGTRIAFAVGEGKNNGPVQVLADKNKQANALVTKIKASGKLLAYGAVEVTEEGHTKFICDRRQPAFRVEALRPYFLRIPEKPLIEDTLDDPAFKDAEDGDGEEDHARGANDPAFDDATNEDEPDVILGPDDEKLVLIWSKSLRKAVEAQGLPRNEPARTIAATFVAGLEDKVEFRLPGLFIRTLKSHNAQPFAQTIVDAINSEFDRCADDVIDALRAEPPDANKAEERVEAFGKKADAIAERAWTAFVERYTIPKDFKRDRTKAIALPAVGGLAASAGLAGSLATGAAPGAAAASVAMFRAALSGLDAYRLYIDDIQTAIDKLESSADRLQRDFVDAEGGAKATAGEGARAALNALSGAGFLGTLKSVRGDVEVLSGRLALKEQKAGNVLPKIDAAMKKLEDGAVEDPAKMKRQITNALDRIADTNSKLAEMRTQIRNTEIVIEKLDGTLKNPALTLEKVEKVTTFIVNAAETCTNLGVGISGASGAVDGIATAAGAIGDILETYESAR